MTCYYAAHGCAADDGADCYTVRRTRTQRSQYSSAVAHTDMRSVLKYAAMRRVYIHARTPIMQRHSATHYRVRAMLYSSTHPTMYSSCATT